MVVEVEGVITMKIQCPYCDLCLNAPDSAWGKTCKCPSCKKQFAVGSSNVVPNHRRTSNIEEDFDFVTTTDKPPMPYYYRTFVHYVLPVKAASLVMTLALALLPFFVGTMPFVLARDIITPRYSSTVLVEDVPTNNKTTTTTTKKEAPVMLSTLWGYAIVFLGGVAYYCFIAVFLLVVWLLVDYAIIMTNEVRLSYHHRQ